VIFHKHLGHAEVALENISTTEPQDSVGGSLMEAVKETKITLIHKLNVKPGVGIVVRNVRYYIHRCQPSFDWLVEDHIYLPAKCNSNFSMFAPISTSTLGYMYMFLRLENVNNCACRCTLDKKYQ
jgi:hypothetical protein